MWLGDDVQDPGIIPECLMYNYINLAVTELLSSPRGVIGMKESKEAEVSDK